MIELDKIILNLIEKAKNSDTVIESTEAKVLLAKELIKTNAYSTTDFFVIVCSINLLNASIKQPKYKSTLTYAEIKGNISRILNYLSTLNFKKYDLDFYITDSEKCAYIEIFGLQFSFHNVNINDRLKAFIASDLNIPKPWKEIRLQKIAEDLFDLAIELRKRVT